MSKGQKSTKEGKKQPVLSLKEKRAAKHHKKDLKDTIQPFMPAATR